MIYTSGSTGRPKAVVVPHRALANHGLAAAPAYGIGESDRRLQFASIGADVFVAEIFNYLSSGAALVLGWDRFSFGAQKLPLTTSGKIDRQALAAAAIPCPASRKQRNR